MRRPFSNREKPFFKRMKQIQTIRFYLRALSNQMRLKHLYEYIEYSMGVNTPQTFLYKRKIIKDKEIFSQPGKKSIFPHSGKNGIRAIDLWYQQHLNYIYNK